MKHHVAWRTDVLLSVDNGKLFYGGDAGHFVHNNNPEQLISNIRMVLQDYKQ